MKKPFVTKELIEKISQEIPTPFHIYDEYAKKYNPQLIEIYNKYNFREDF